MVKSKDQVVTQLLEIAKVYEDSGDVDRGQGIRDLMSEVNSGQQDHSRIKINAKVSIQKFDGEKVDGDNKVPVEITEFISEL
jgi:hypothetical protein